MKKNKSIPRSEYTEHFLAHLQQSPESNQIIHNHNTKHKRNIQTKFKNIMDINKTIEKRKEKSRNEE